MERELSVADLHGELVMKIHSLLHAPPPTNCLKMFVFRHQHEQRKNDQKLCFLLWYPILCTTHDNASMSFKREEILRSVPTYRCSWLFFSFFCFFKWQNCYSGEHLVRKVAEEKPLMTGKHCGLHCCNYLAIFSSTELKENVKLCSSCLIVPIPA